MTSHAVYNERKSDERGFTLIELMNVVAIAGVLAVVAMSAFEHYLARARRGEGLQALSELYDRQVEYYNLNDQTYAPTFEELGVIPDGEFKLLDDGSIQGRYYNIVIIAPDTGESYRMIASANLDTDDYIDILEIRNSIL